MAASGSTTGIVKSYNGAKGYGFIKADGFDKDIMFTRQVLPSDATNVNGKFLEGRQVAFLVEEKADGKYAANSLQIPAVEGQELMGAIKNFSDKNGYGFITSSAIEGSDIRFDARDLPYQMSRDQVKGALVVFQLQVLPDQKLRASQLQFQSDGAGGKDGGKGGHKGAPMAPVVPAAVYPMQGGYGKGMQAAYPDPYYGKGAPGKGHMSTPYGKGGGKAPPQAAGKGGGVGVAKRIAGFVKTFSEWNGYGFLNVAGTPGDIKFGRADLLGVDTVAPGQPVTFLASAAPDGRVKAQEVTPDHGGQRPMMQNMQNGHSGAGFRQQRPPQGGVAEAADGEPATGIVKNFNPAKGFGFITVQGKSGDIYLGKAALPEEFHQSELAGATVSFEIALSKDGSGKMRAQNVMIEALGQ